MNNPEKKKRGRPAFPDGEAMSRPVTVLLRPAELEALRAEARETRKSLSKKIREKLGFPSEK